VEYWALWGEHNRVHVQNMHANDQYHNVTEHKPQATVHETKSTDIGLCTTPKLGQAS